MKIRKRILTFCLVVVVLLTTVPLAFGAEEEKLTAQAEELTFSGTGLGKVLSSASENAEEEDPNYGVEKFYIVRDNIAYVKYHAISDCKIVLAVYAEDTVQMLATGMKNVSAEETEVNIIIDIDEMPKYYFLKAYMLDSLNAPLGIDQANFEHTRVFETFDSKTINDFPERVVVNLDEQEDDNFAVLKSGALEMPYDGVTNVLTSFDEATGTYWFSNVDSIIRNLVAGDVLTFTVEQNIYILQVQQCEIYADGSAKVTETQDAAMEELFTYIDVDVDSAETGEGMTYDQSGDASAFEISGYEAWDEGDDYDLKIKAPRAKEEIIDIPETSKSVSCPIFDGGDDGHKKYIVGDKDSNFSIYGFAQLKLLSTAHFRLYYDADLSVSAEWRWDVWNAIHVDFQSFAYFKMQLDLAVKGTIGFTISAGGEFTLTHMGFYGIPGVSIEGDIKIGIEGSVTLSASIEITWTLGVAYDSDTGWINLCGQPKVGWMPKGAVEVSVEVYIKFTPKIKALYVVGVELPMKLGVEFSIGAEVDVADLVDPMSRSKIHTCPALTCFEGDISVFLEVSVEGTIFNKAFATKTLKPKASIKLCDLYMRLSPFSVQFGSKCPNHAYRCDFTVVNKDNKPIKNLDIQSGGPDFGKKYKYNVLNATDDSGKVSFFYPKGSFTPDFFLNGQEVEVSKIRSTIFNSTVSGCSITMIDTTKSVKVQLDTTAEDGGGSGHNSGGNLSEFNGHYYMVFDEGMTWNEANDNCHSLGGHLVTITSEEEQQFVWSIVSVGLKNSYWLGAIKVGNWRDNKFQWITGEDWSYDNGHYNNASKEGGEDCLMMYRLNNPIVYEIASTWNDLNHNGRCGNEAFFGTENFGFICEWESNPVKSKSSSNPQKAIAETDPVGSYQIDRFGTFQYTASGCAEGNDYILLNVTNYGNDFTLATENLEYIDQITADESGAVSGTFLPRNAVPGSTTLLIGDFGSGVEVLQLTQMLPTHTPGDINGDGVLNNKDLNRLMKKLAGEDVDCVEAALDVNGDGVVNNKDLNRLMKKLAGEDVQIF